MFYLLLITEKVLCLTDNTNLPIEFADNLHLVRTFYSMDEAEMYLHATLSFDDMWSFGLMDPHAYLTIGKVYYRI